METYITGPAIKRLREARGLTQAELGEKVGVGSKAVSKWENARGLPDVSLIEPLAEALGVSVMELMNGEKIRNQNVCANMLRTKICVCPVCGNILCGTGSAVISCCGVTLPPLEAEEADEAHRPDIQQVEDELFVTLDHPSHDEIPLYFLPRLRYRRPIPADQALPGGQCPGQDPPPGQGRPLSLLQPSRPDEMEPTVPSGGKNVRKYRQNLKNPQNKRRHTAPFILWKIVNESAQYLRDSRDSASSRVISPALHRAMICTSLSLSL